MTMKKAVPEKAFPITGYEDLDNFLQETFEVMRKKGHDYRQGNDADLLHNFRNVAKQVGTAQEKVWFTYFYKHYAALTTFIKNGGQSESEPIEGRITDMIVYLVLFYRMVQERKNVKEPTVPDVQQTLNELVRELSELNTTPAGKNATLEDVMEAKRMVAERSRAPIDTLKVYK